MTYILYNIKDNSIEIIDEKDVLDKLYYFEYRPINNNDIKKYKKMDKISDLINDKNIVDKMKIKISKIEDKIPLYDSYSNNIFLINKFNVYERVVNQYYRFPDGELLVQLKEKDGLLKSEKNLDILEERNLKKINLMLKFMNYFDLEILYDTYMKVFYKYSVFTGMEITTCPRPSFVPIFYHLKPYFTRSEIINISLNLGLDIKKDIEYDKLKKLCKKVMENEIDFEMLLKHKKYMIGQKSLGMIQYYTLQGSYIMNQYLRNNTIYKDKNIFLENLISPMWNLIKESPEFDKNYTLYRFIKNDDFLRNLKIGETFTEKGFMSTTRNPFYGSEDYDFGTILIKVNIPKNINGVALCLETISHFPEEQEILFPPKSNFKLIKKDSDCIYYHTDINISSKIKTKYEFDWISNEDIYFSRESKEKNDKFRTDFLKINRKINVPLNEKINYFENNYVNKMGQFLINLADKEFVVMAERFDSTGAYKKFYAMEIKNGFSIYTIYDNYILFFIEVGETNNGIEQIHINYYAKHSAIEPNKIIGDEKLIMLYSSIAYYFDIHNVYIYANYMNCNVSEDDDNKSKIFGGSYCVDFYQYFTMNIKRYSDLDVLNNELYPMFSYYELDFLKTISPQKILIKEDNEIYQIYKKIYCISKNSDNIIDFYIWLKNYKCYLLDIFISLIDRILGENNPFKRDIYELDPISYLYNRKYIKVYSSRFSIIKEIKRDVISK